VLFYSNSPVWEEYLPGQYITLKHNSIDTKCWIASHHFGADLPSIIIPQSLSNGLKNGDILQLSKPEGNFTLNPVSNFKRSFIFLGQDEGVIPIYVMLQSLLYVENMSKAGIYAISKNDVALFFDEIDFLKNMVHGRIKCELETNKKTFSITKLNSLFEFLAKEHSPLFYVCGGKSFIDKVADFMLKKKIPISNMQYFKTPLN
jgi:ring-1,2-phenylacetyl-CoA epoxidase subunit PaaE